MALFTAAEFRAHIGSSDSSLDTFLGNLADRISAAVNAFTRRTIEAPDSNITRYFDGPGTPELFLPDYPVQTIASVHEDGSRNFDSSTALTEGTHFIVYESSGELVRLSGGPTLLSGRLVSNEGNWIKGRGVIKIVYKAGYGTVPDDIKLAAIVWGAAIMSRRNHHGKTTFSLGNFSETFERGSMPEFTREILNRYKRPPMVNCHE